MLSCLRVFFNIQCSFSTDEFRLSNFLSAKLFIFILLFFCVPPLFGSFWFLACLLCFFTVVLAGRSLEWFFCYLFSCFFASLSQNSCSLHSSCVPILHSFICSITIPLFHQKFGLPHCFFGFFHCCRFGHLFFSKVFWCVRGFLPVSLRAFVDLFRFSFSLSFFFSRMCFFSSFGGFSVFRFSLGLSPNSKTFVISKISRLVF